MLMPADGMSAALKKDFGTSRRAAPLSSYLTRASMRKGLHDRFWPEDEVNGCPLARQLSEAKLTLCASCKGRRFAISATRRACNFRNNAGLPLALQRTLSKELDGKRECENRCIDEYTVLVFLAGQPSIVWA